MGRASAALSTFNRGRISKLALGRVDLQRVQLSAEYQKNWMPRTLGSMMLRPGLQYIGAIYDHSPCRIVPFIFNSTDTALLEVTAGAMRVWVQDAVVQRAQSTSVITNSAFSSSDLSGWTEADETGSTSMWVSGGYLGLAGTRYARAIRRQQVSGVAGSRGITVHVDRGYPILRIGSSAGGDDYFSETELKTGHYSLKITSTGDFFIELSANTEYLSLLSEVSVENQGDMILDATWLASDLSKLRWAQSNDVIFVACAGYQQKRIERYGTESWALVDYIADDGPFRSINTSSVQLSPSARTGDITLDASRDIFDPDHVGSLFEITSIGQSVDGSFTGPTQNSDSVRVSGVEAARALQILITSVTSSSPIYIQRSIDEQASWQTVTSLKYTSTIDSTYNDGLANTIAYYRMYTPSTFNAALTSSGTLNYSGGGIIGRARVTGFNSATQVTASVVKNFGSTSASDLWSESVWSDFRGWPSATVLHEGRLWWAGKSRVQGSVSDAYNSFDANSTGDSGPINRIIASGSNDTIQWMQSLTRLMFGTPRQEFQAKTSSLEEPLTPTNFNVRDISTYGTADVSAVKIDQRVLFTQGGGTRIMEIALQQSYYDYVTTEQTILCPEIGEPSIERMAVQRQPDTRLHCIRSDGTVAVMVTDPAENVLAWIDVETQGEVEEAAVLPGSQEDNVYYVVAREINGSTVRYLEKWATEKQARGSGLNRIADSFVVQDSSVATVDVVGIDHLIGQSVVVWGSTDDLGTYTVSTEGRITLSTPSTYTCVGLGYDALYVSNKLAYAAGSGTALSAKKKLDHLGLILSDTHSRGIMYGPSTSRLQYMPQIDRGAMVSTGSVWSSYDSEVMIFPGSWDTDSRVVLTASAPRPVTVLAAIIGIETRDKT